MFLENKFINAYVFLTIVVASSTSYSLTLDEYLQKIILQHKSFRSLSISLERVEDKRLAGDIDLVPNLTAKINSTSDQTQPSQFGQKINFTDYSLGVAKKFSTGTSLQLNGKVSDYDIKGSRVGIDKFTTGVLSVGLSQSLWKDSFGRAIDLRRQRDSLTAKLENQTFTLKQRQLLIQAESAYWDYLVAIEDLKIKKENLERAKRLSTWVQKRVYNGIADEADLLNAQALVSSREFQYLTSEDDLLSKKITLSEYLYNTDEMDKSVEVTIPQLTSKLNVNRRLVFNTNGNHIRIDSYLKILDAELKKTIAEEVKDSFKPDLSLEGLYATNNLDDKAGDSFSKLTNNDKPTTSIGLKFTYLLDTEVKSAQIKSAQKESQIALLEAEHEVIVANNFYREFVRKYDVLKKQTETAQKIADIQVRRAKSENERYSKGRSITSTVITAEQEAAEAQVSLLNLLAALRKLESQSQLFVPYEG